MVISEYIRLLLFTVAAAETSDFSMQDDFQTKDEACQVLAIKPHFEINMVVGKRWTAYYAWNFKKKADGKCMEFSFKNATRGIINRIWIDMYDYLEIQPPWEEAMLVMTTTARHEMLLFTDVKVPGRFIGVANVVRSENVPPSKKNSVPLFELHMKLFQEDKYLVVSDCNVGVTTVAIHSDAVTSRGILEIKALVTSLEFGEGTFVCALKNDLEDLFEGEVVAANSQKDQLK